MKKKPAPTTLTNDQTLILHRQAVLRLSDGDEYDRLYMDRNGVSHWRNRYDGTLVKVILSSGRFLALPNGVQKSYRPTQDRPEGQIRESRSLAEIIASKQVEPR